MFSSMQDTLEVLSMTARNLLQTRSATQSAKALDRIVVNARSVMELRKKKGDLLSNPDAVQDRNMPGEYPIKSRTDRHGNIVIMLRSDVRYYVKNSIHNEQISNSHNESAMFNV